FLGALFFAVQPADVDAVAWVSALAEPVSAGLGCAATLCFLRYRRSGSFWQYGVSIGSFVLALLTHESAVVFAALIPLADWADERQGSRAAMPYAGYGIALALYLAVDLVVNSRNYVVTEGHYGLGAHVVVNLFDYVVALYVGKRDIVNYVIVGASLT